MESEILIVDEVLAVGDAEFQKKCLGKMEDVNKGEGRTILFVSHNMAAIQNLCNNIVLMNNGMLQYMGSTESAISLYNQQSVQFKIDIHDKKDLYIKNFSITSVFSDYSIVDSAVSNEKVLINMEIFSKYNQENVNVGYGINDSMGVRLITPFSKHLEKKYKILSGINKIVCEIPAFPLKPGIYGIEIFIGNDLTIFEYYNSGLSFEVIPSPKLNLFAIPDSSQGNFIINQIWK